jgi:hypothetical protein
MSESFPLPTEPKGVIPSLLKRFNSGEIEAMVALYAPEAVFVANDGRTITDRAEFTAILEHDIKLGLPLKANVRAMCSSAATPPRLCSTGQLTEQVLTLHEYCAPSRRPHISDGMLTVLRAN